MGKTGRQILSLFLFCLNVFYQFGSQGPVRAESEAEDV